MGENAEKRTSFTVHFSALEIFCCNCIFSRIRNKLTAEVFYVKNSNETKNKYGNLSFYLVLALCAVMIGVSCWFAYTQTANDLTIQLDSALDSASNTAGMRAAESSPAAAETTARSAAHVPEAVTTLPETAPETTADAQDAAAVITETQPQTTETAEEAAASAKLAAEYPITGEIIAPFSNGELVKSATTGVWQTHNGIDIAAAVGDEVRAMSDGVVEAVEEDPLWGVCVTIDHKNGVRSRYCNLNAGLTVNTGDSVTCGMVIGAVGDTADMESALESHLHFEVMQGNSYVDPVSFIED